MTNLTCGWGTSEPILKEINMTIKNGELIVISGPVGSGKSSLINLLLDEVDIHDGELSMKGKVSYCSQEPWIFRGSIRQNILFGLDFESEKYSAVIRASCLHRDLKLFAEGDMAMVGDKGNTLSGGQKARIVGYRLQKIF